MTSSECTSSPSFATRMEFGVLRTCEVTQPVSAGIRRQCMFLGGALLFTMILPGCPSKWPPLLGGPPSPAKYSAEEIRGRVVDEETEQPLSGVTVAVTWDLRDRKSVV